MSSAQPGPGLFVEKISKSFRGRPVVKEVSLRLERGEVAGLLGPNGAGKTTCFYMITGLVPADRGRIYLDGDDITRQPMFQRARMGLGYLPQETSIFRGMSVEENVCAVVELHHGVITVDSEEGKGTTFTILIPIRQPRPGEETTPPPASRSVAAS